MRKMNLSPEVREVFVMALARESSFSVIEEGNSALKSSRSAFKLLYKKALIVDTRVNARHIDEDDIVLVEVLLERRIIRDFEIIEEFFESHPFE